MKIKELTAYLEEMAPTILQESYDNAGSPDRRSGN